MIKKDKNSLKIRKEKELEGFKMSNETYNMQ